MANDFVMELLNSALQEKIEEFRANGLSDSEIIDRISEFKIENALTKVTEAMSSDAVDTIESTMYERVLEERSKTEQFMVHNSQIWGKAFVVSDAMYLIALEAGSDINACVSATATEQHKEKMFRYCVLGELYGRACQQYLEIIHLVKGGFADGAYARWRSLFELSVISEFIRNNDEAVAKAYFNDVGGEKGRLDWAKLSPCIAERLRREKRSNVRFSDIKDECSMATDAWNNQYWLANKVVHASPQGTFDRLGLPSGPRKFTPVGHSDYGLATPAINAAISLSSVAADYFGFVSRGGSIGDPIVYIRVLTKWANLAREYYAEIEAKCFNEQKNDT